MDGLDSPIDVSEINPQPSDQTAEDTLSPKDKLPELVPSVKGRISSPAGLDNQPLQLPEVKSAISTSSLVQSMGLAEDGERSLGSLLHLLHTNVLGALEEVQAVTTHDNNLETQYNEALSENTKLKAALNRARREISHLKGRLSVLELTAADVREEHNRKLQTRQRIIRQESNLLQRTQKKDLQGYMFVPSFQERSKTVDCRGKYIQSYVCRSKQFTYCRKRHPTFPPRTLPAVAVKSEPLPPPLHGCNCSVCNSQQSMGALTIGKKSGRSICSKSGQQILLGDRVVITGDKLGCVRYIGKLEFDPLQRVFIGVHLDTPVGVCDGAVRGRRYFQCPQSHGVFVLAEHILCVTGRRPFPLSTTVPRVRKSLPSTSQRDETASSCPKTQEQQVDSPLSSTPSALTQARTVIQEELNQLLAGTNPSQLVNPSVTEMSKRITDLQSRPRQPLPPDTEPEKEEENQEKEEHQEQETVSIAMVADGRSAAEEPKEEPDSGQDQEELMDSQPVADDPQRIQDFSPQVTEDQDRQQFLVNRLVSVLEDKDLGSTGFVTINELAAAVVSEFQLSQGELKMIMSKLGLQDAEGGIEYMGLTTDIAEAIQQLRDH